MLKPEPEPDTDEGIGTLFTRLIDDGGQLIRAEIELYRQMSIHRLLRSRVAVVLAVTAILLIQGSVTALLVGLLFGLARWVGPVGAGVAVCLAGLLGGALLLRAAARRIAAAVDPESDGTS